MASLSAILFPAAAQGASLKVTRAGNSAGRVLSTPAAIDCGDYCGAEFPDGTVVTLRAADIPSVVWDGDCTGPGECVLTLDQNRAVNATFDYALTLGLIGDGWGTVETAKGEPLCSPAPGATTCQTFYPQGTTLVLMATPNELGTESKGPEAMLCVNESGTPLDYAAIHDQEEIQRYARLGAVRQPLADAVDAAPEGTIFEVWLWPHALSTNTTAMLRGDCLDESCPDEAARLADLAWRNNYVAARIAQLGGEVVRKLVGQPVLRARLTAPHVAQLQFDPQIHIIDGVQTLAPSGMVVDQTCNTRLDVGYAAQPARTGSGVRLGLYELARPSAAPDNLVFASPPQTYAPISAPNNIAHARAMAYLIRNNDLETVPNTQGGVAPSVSLFMLSSSALDWALSVALPLRLDILNSGIEIALIENAARDLRRRPIEARLLDYTATIGTRPLVVSPSGNEVDGHPCNQVQLPLYNGLVVAYTVPDPQVEVTSLACALRKPKAAASGAEGNPTGRFGPEWELPHAWGPGDLDFASDTARANWVGTSFAAAFASATAATTIQAFRDAQPSVPPGFPLQPLLGLPQEALRAALSASGGRLPIDHGVESCSEPLHKLAEQVDGVQAAAIVRNRAPRGSVPSQSGFDALTLTSADFSRCGSRPVPPNHPPNTTFCVAGPPTWWAMQSPGLRAGVSRVRLRVVLTWSVPQTCYLLQMCGRQGPAPESCLRRGVCASDASPPDLDLLVITPGGALAGPTTAMFEGTWETVDIDASVAGTYAVGVGLWNPNKLQAPIGSGFQVPIGLAWSLIEEPAP